MVRLAVVSLHRCWHARVHVCAGNRCTGQKLYLSLKQGEVFYAN